MNETVQKEQDTFRFNPKLIYWHVSLDPDATHGTVAFKGLNGKK